jgi:aspartate aminotransferase
MRLSDRMSRLGTESAFKVLAQAQALEAKGNSVVHLEIGEPDFDTPKHITEAAFEALKKGQTHYVNSQGILPLRKEIAKHMQKTTGVAIDPNRIIVTPGAKPIMFFTILTLLQRGDECIYPDPGFPIYESMIKYTGAKAVPIPLREELEFSFSIDDLEKRITPQTRMIVLNSPHNPTGGILTEKDIRGIAELARKHDITVFSDEVYDHIIYNGEPFSITSLPGMLDRTILLNGFSKTYAMTGWRLGYAVVPKEMVEHIIKLIANSFSCTPAFIQYAGIAALTGPQDSVPKMAAEFQKRRDLIVNGLNSIPGVSCRLPRGAFYVFPNVKSFGKSSQEIATYLLNEGGVASLAGTAFGKYGEGYLRFSYATSTENINEALKRIRAALAKLQV